MSSNLGCFVFIEVDFQMFMIGSFNYRKLIEEVRWFMVMEKWVLEFKDLTT